MRDRLMVLKEQVRLGRKQAIVLSVLAVMSILGGLWAAGQTATTPFVEEKAAEPPGTAGTTARSSALGADSTATSSNQHKKEKPDYVLVHVAGDVVNPGVHKVKAGGRVNDAVEAAGGPMDGVDLDNLNLAAKVSDGQKVFVKEGSISTSEGHVDEGTDLVNINYAGTGDLERLNGVGPVLAERIIAWREEHGGFSSISQLRQVNGIGPKKYDVLKGQVLLY